MHHPFVIQGPFAFRQDAKLGSCLLMISKKKQRHLSGQDLQPTLSCQFEKQLRKGTATQQPDQNGQCYEYRKFLLLLWLGSGEKATSNEATSANAEMSLQYVML